MILVEGVGGPLSYTEILLLPGQRTVKISTNIGIDGADGRLEVGGEILVTFVIGISEVNRIIRY